MAYNLFSKISYQNFTLTGLYGSRSKGIPTGSFGTVFNDSRNKTVDGLGYLELKYERTLPSDWGVLTRLGYNFNTYDGYYYYLSSGRIPFRYLNRDVGRSQWLDGEIQVTKRLFDRHMIIAGAEFQQYLNMNQQNYDVTPYRSYLNDRPAGRLLGPLYPGRICPASRPALLCRGALRSVFLLRGHLQPQAGPGVSALCRHHL